MRKRRKTILCLLCSVLLPLALSACSPAEGGAPSEGQAAAAEGPADATQPVTLTYWRTLDDDAYNVVDNLGEVACYREIERLTGIHVEFVHPVQGQADEEFTIMIASGSYPDMIYYPWTNYPGGPDKAIADGVAIELESIIEEQAPNLSRLLDNNEEVAKQMRTEKGNVFAFPFLILDDYLRSPLGVQVRKDWLDALSLDAPETIEDWNNVLRAFKTGDPNGNGIQDEIPLSSVMNSGVPNLLDAYFPISAWGMTHGFYQEEGKVLFGPIEPGYKDYVETMRAWYREGLLDPDFVSTDRESFEDKIFSDRAGAWVKTGDSRRAESLLDDIFNRSLCLEQRVSADYIRCLSFDIMSTTIKILDEEGIPADAVFAPEQDPYAELTRCDTFDDMKAALLNAYRGICEYINENKANSGSSLIDALRDYVDKNYANANLSLTFISEVFSMNGAYLSRVYKQQLGMSLIDYLAKVRVQKASELLAATPESIESIATRVGFCNASAQYAVNGYTGVEEMLENEELDLVVIASPTLFHEEHARLAMEHGCDVFLDKPMATSLDEAARIVKTKEATGRRLMVYQPYRLIGEVLELFRILEKDLIGSVYMVKRAYSEYTRRNDWQAVKANGGGMLNNYGSHQMDLLLAIADSEIERVRCHMYAVATAGDADDVVKILAETKKGMTLELDINTAAASPMPAWIIYGKRGAITLEGNPGEQYFRVVYYSESELGDLALRPELAAEGRTYSSGDNIIWHEERFPVPAIDPALYYEKCYEYFTLGEAPLVPVEKTYEVMKFLDACRQDAGW